MTQIIPAFNTKPKTLLMLVTTSILSLSIIGCGSDSGGNSNDNSGSTPPVSSASFSETATWQVTNLALGTATCYDFDAKAESACEGDNWDIKFENEARSPKLWSNSGDSGQGKGGVFGLIDWSDLGRYSNAIQDPDTSRDIIMHYNEDRSGGIFNTEPWFEYNLKEAHQLYPNNRVYLITNDNSSAITDSGVQQPIYAMQIINYYNDTGASGYPTIRWIDTALPNKVKTNTIDASNNDNWVYFDLKTGQSSTDKNSIWQVGFKRNDVILNGGDSAVDSNKGKVGGYLAATPAGYYSDKEGDDQDAPIVSQFLKDNTAATLTDLTNIAAYTKPSSARDWVIDSKGSDLNPAYTGNFPNLDFGWYTYNGMTHQLNAKPIETSKGALIRSAEGNSYARLRLDKINYPDNSTTTATSWEFKLDIQPAP
ncbi:HmuY family protein [Psychrobacter sp. AOP22-C1-22]|uniref:HmuY family protein n=1 Tax=unclassified Psychrobacter TaxID=196806 RepID=UPI0017887C2E|nr:HmuY family protein [Psychrobacter sp. FME6]MBE0405978.1 HmuY family protein [Psychrobacter sp. FME6]MDN5801907.1 HmuY family protein [Psychrobacter sp.]